MNFVFWIVVGVLLVVSLIVLGLSGMMFMLIIGYYGLFILLGKIFIEVVFIINVELFMNNIFFLVFVVIGIIFVFILFGKVFNYVLKKVLKFFY